MINAFEKRWLPHHKVVENKLGDETVILHLDSGTYFGLDTIGTTIWALLKDGLRPEDICNRLIDEFDVELSKAQADVLVFLNNLIEQNLLIEG